MSTDLIKHTDISTVLIDDVEIPVEVATDPVTGLSGRDELATGTGMFFDLDGHPVITMRGMKFSLDVIWISEDKKVVDISRNTLISVLGNDTLYSPEKPARYALEINAGEAQKRGIKVGDEVEINLLPNSDLTRLLVLEEVLEHLLKEEQRDYDPEGKHRGKRGGKYFLPGERATGGKQVDVVQAPEAAPEEDKWVEWRKKTEGFVQGLLDPESGAGFFGDFKTKQVNVPWEDDNRQNAPNGHVKRTRISGKRVQLLLNNLNKLYNSKNRTKNGMPGQGGGRGVKERYGWKGDLFGGDERQQWLLEIDRNGAGILELWDGSRREAAEGKQIQEKEQAVEQAKDEDPLTSHFGGDLPQQIVQDFIQEFMAQNPGNLPSPEDIGKHLAAKQVLPIPKEFADRLGGMAEYLDIEKSANELSKLLALTTGLEYLTKAVPGEKLEYLKPGEKAPRGIQVQRGARGGRGYYPSEVTAVEEETAVLEPTEEREIDVVQAPEADQDRDERIRAEVRQEAADAHEAYMQSEPVRRNLSSAQKILDGMPDYTDAANAGPDVEFEAGEAFIHDAFNFLREKIEDSIKSLKRNTQGVPFIIESRLNDFDRATRGLDFIFGDDGKIRSFANSVEHKKQRIFMIERVVVSPEIYKKERSTDGTKLMMRLMHKFITESNATACSILPLDEHVGKYYRKFGFDVKGIGLQISKEKAKESFNKYARHFNMDIVKQHDKDFQELIDLENEVGILANNKDISLKSQNDNLSKLLTLNTVLEYLRKQEPGKREYLAPGEEAPEGVRVERGTRGGRYYDPGKSTTLPEVPSSAVDRALADTEIPEEEREIDVVAPSGPEEQVAFLDLGPLDMLNPEVINEHFDTVATNLEDQLIKIVGKGHKPFLGKEILPSKLTADNITKAGYTDGTKEGTSDPSGMGINSYQNFTVIIETEGQQKPFIYKMVPGENRGELLAYSIDRVLGLNIVPFAKQHSIAMSTLSDRVEQTQGKPIFGAQIVEMRERGVGERAAGHFQEFCENCVSSTERTKLAAEMLSTATGREEFFKIMFLDYLTGNHDRHTGNYLITEDKKMVAIDNGMLPSTHIPHQKQTSLSLNSATFGYFSFPYDIDNEMENVKPPTEAELFYEASNFFDKYFDLDKLDAILAPINWKAEFTEGYDNRSVERSATTIERFAERFVTKAVENMQDALSTGFDYDSYDRRSELLTPFDFTKNLKQELANEDINIEVIRSLNFDAHDIDEVDLEEPDIYEEDEFN